MKIEIELDNLTEEEQETARNWANRSERYWTPKFGEYYFSLGSDGSIYEVQKNEDAIDEFNLATGNFFRTVEEAEENRTRLKMCQLWKKLSIEAGESDNPWDGTHVHWTVYFEDGALHYLDHSCMICATTHFPSIESLKNAIAKLGEENVKRYILGVKE